MTIQTDNKLSRRWIWSLALLAAFPLLAICGCASLGQRKLAFHDEYFLRKPTTVAFVYQRDFADGSFATGRLEYRVMQVVWGDPSVPGYSYHMLGVVSHGTRGRATTVETAFAIVPTEQLKQALDASEVNKVFVPCAPSSAGITVSGQVVAYSVHPENATTLLLPLEYELLSAGSLDTGLQGHSRQWAIEVALVWLKDLQARLGLLDLGTQATLATIDETPQRLVMTLRLGRESTSSTWVLTFMRGQSLTQLNADLSDGSRLTMRADTENGTAEEP